MSDTSAVGQLTAKTSQYSAFVQSDMVRLVALDLVLRLVLAGMVDVALVVHVFLMHADDMASDAAGFRIPADVIATLERLTHAHRLKRAAPPDERRRILRNHVSSAAP